MARPEQHQEPFWNPPTSHSFWQVKEEEEEEPYPYQYPTYPSQYTPYNAEFISPSVTPAPYTVGSRTGSTCSTPPPVPVVPYLGNDWDDGDRSILQGHYSSPRDAGHEEIIDIRPLPAVPVPVTPPDPDASTLAGTTLAEVGQVGSSTQKNRATIVDVEKVAAAPTTGGAFVTVFGKRYNKRPVIIIAVVITLIVIIAIGLGAGLGNKGGGNTNGSGNQEGNDDGGVQTGTGNPDNKDPKPTKNNQLDFTNPVGEAHQPIISNLPFTPDPDSDDNEIPNSVPPDDAIGIERIIE